MSATLVPVAAQAVEELAGHLHTAGARLAAAADRIDGCAGWSGPAASAAQAAAGTWTRHTGQAEAVLAAAVPALRRLAEDLHTLHARDRATHGRLAEVQAEWDRRAIAAGSAGDPAVLAWLDTANADLDRTRLAIQTDYQQVAGHAIRTLDGLRRGIDDRPLSWRDQAEAAAELATETVRGTIELGTTLTVGLLDDPVGWARAWSDLAAGAVDTARHPDQALRDATYADQFEQGYWLAGILGVSGSIAGRGAGLPLKPDPLKPAKDGDHGDESSGFRPRPVPQTPHEIAAHGVDLDRHEHPELGHTLERHVEVTDEDLVQRLTTPRFDAGGQPLPDLKYASRWTDRATAEDAITRTIQSNLHDIEKWLATRSIKPKKWVLTMDEPVGVTYLGSTKAASNRPPTTTIVILKRKGDDVFVLTAYPQP